MFINKQAKNKDEFPRKWFDYSRAREAFEAYLVSLKLTDDEHIIIPNYIGFSAREGSGVFDPITGSGVNWRFYELDDNLCIQMSSIQKLIDEGGVAALVIIHYFGYVDPAYIRLIELARKNNIKIIEDQAHSLFTDIYGGLTGRLCDASVYSLHKMFPVDLGGGLSIVNAECDSTSKNIASICLERDIYKISIARIRNANFLSEKLINHSEVLSVMRPNLDAGVVPQTFPILISQANRNNLYEAMNNAGFGVVSLYHTMIDEISLNKLFATNEVSRTILNLPVHQDADEKNLDLMCDFLFNILYLK